MRRILFCVLVAMFINVIDTAAQEHPFTLSVSGSFSTSSKLFPHSDDPDGTIRNQFLPLDDLFGIALDIRRQFDIIGIQLGLNVEYISKTESYPLQISSTKSVPLTDGFTAIPIELSGYFTIPIGDETIQLYMGGGGGLYWGNRNYRIADVRAVTVGRTAGVGIHILSGVQFTLAPGIFLQSEVKFRDVQFQTVNRFAQQYATYNGYTILLDQRPFASRISMNGMTLTLSLAVNF